MAFAFCKRFSFSRKVNARGEEGHSNNCLEICASSKTHKRPIFLGEPSPISHHGITAYPHSSISSDDVIITSYSSSIVTVAEPMISIHTWIHLSAAALYQACDEQHQQQQYDDAHQDDEPAGRRATVFQFICAPHKSPNPLRSMQYYYSGLAHCAILFFLMGDG